MNERGEITTNMTNTDIFIVLLLIESGRLVNFLKRFYFFVCFFIYLMCSSGGMGRGREHLKQTSP